MKTTQTESTATTGARYITRKDCPCGAGRTSAISVGRNLARSASEGAVFYGDTAFQFGDICIVCRGCGRNRGAVAVRGKFSAKHTCGAKCLASTGPLCECSCGGKNHGAGHQ